MLLELQLLRSAIHHDGNISGEPIKIRIYRMIDHCDKSN